LLFVIPKQSTTSNSIQKLKSDIEIALKKIASIPTGSKVLNTAKEKGLPILVELCFKDKNNDGGSYFENAEAISPDFSKCVFNKNYDKLVWYPYVGVTFINQNKSLARMPPWITLLHELGHAHAANNDRKNSLAKLKTYPELLTGIAKNNMTDIVKKDSNGVSIEEKRNLLMEQKAMREAGLIPRTKYNLTPIIHDVKSPLQLP
jgi:hypothetical protein